MPSTSTSSPPGSVMPKKATLAPIGPAQPVADDDAHIGGVEPGQCLRNLERREEAFLVQPAFAQYQSVAQVGDHTAAERGRADDEKGEEYLD